MDDLLNAIDDFKTHRPNFPKLQKFYKSFELRMRQAATNGSEAQPATPHVDVDHLGNREASPDDAHQVSVSRKELDILFNAVRALELIRVLEEADGEQAIITVAVLLESNAEPSWEVVSDLQGRFREEELREAGQLGKLESAVDKIAESRSRA